MKLNGSVRELKKKEKMKLKEDEEEEEEGEEEEEEEKEEEEEEEEEEEKEEKEKTDLVLTFILFKRAADILHATEMAQLAVEQHAETLQAGSLFSAGVVGLIIPVGESFTV